MRSKHNALIRQAKKRLGTSDGERRARAKQRPGVKEGFLDKRGVTNKAFKTRYFIMIAPFIAYYENKPEKAGSGRAVKEKGLILLTPRTVVQVRV